MPKQVVEFAFSVGQPVDVIEIKAHGVIQGLWASDRAERYLVSWWMNGTMVEEYLWAHEIRAKDPS